MAAAPAAAVLDFTDKGVLKDQVAHSLVEYTAGGFGVVSNRAIHSDKIVIFATGVPAGTGVSVDDFQSSIKAILPGVISIGGKQGPALKGAGIVHQGITYELFAVGANPGDQVAPALVWHGEQVVCRALQLLELGEDDRTPYPPPARLGVVHDGRDHRL